MDDEASGSECGPQETDVPTQASVIKIVISVACDMFFLLTHLLTSKSVVGIVIVAPRSSASPMCFFVCLSVWNFKTSQRIFICVIQNDIVQRPRTFHEVQQDIFQDFLPKRSVHGS